MKKALVYSLFVYCFYSFTSAWAQNCPNVFVSENRAVLSLDPITYSEVEKQLAAVHSRQSAIQTFEKGIENTSYVAKIAGDTVSIFKNNLKFNELSFNYNADVVLKPSEMFTTRGVKRVVYGATTVAPVAKVPGVFIVGKSDGTYQLVSFDQAKVFLDQRQNANTYAGSRGYFFSRNITPSMELVARFTPAYDSKIEVEIKPQKGLVQEAIVAINAGSRGHAHLLRQNGDIEFVNLISKEVLLLKQRPKTKEDFL